MGEPPAGRRVYEDIALQLEQRIQRCELPEGALLPSQRDLASLYGVSRTSIREALLSLQIKGLIAIEQRTRARVTYVTNPSFIHQLTGIVQALLAQPNGAAAFQEARGLLEGGLARHAALHASPKDIARLEWALEQNRLAMHDPELFVATDMAFHGILAEIPGNPLFTALNAALSDWLMAQRKLILRAVAGSLRRAYEGHQEIYAAVAGHDAIAAERAMTQHLETVAGFLWQALTRQPIQALTPPSLSLEAPAPSLPSRGV